MILINKCLKEFTTPEYKVSYDELHDILRVFSDPFADFSFETFDDFVEIAVDERSSLVVGVQISGFVNNIDVITDEFTDCYPAFSDVISRTRSMI
ncbi:hypothetical protein [Enterococcus italicus]|uniref:hypothetical protein n=1 Tax=Enterococcus italicus TaxID=246144 RepID=UPI002073A937|nr:hypothetical protein [Enterococcus italicus]